MEGDVQAAIDNGEEFVKIKVDTPLNLMIGILTIYFSVKAAPKGI